MSTGESKVHRERAYMRALDHNLAQILCHEQRFPVYTHQFLRNAVAAEAVGKASAHSSTKQLAPSLQPEIPTFSQYHRVTGSLSRCCLILLRTMTSKLYHLVPTATWQEVVTQKVDYFPPTYTQDGFIHLTKDPALLLSVANHFYKDVPGTLFSKNSIL